MVESLCVEWGREFVCRMGWRVCVSNVVESVSNMVESLCVECGGVFVYRMCWRVPVLVLFSLIMTVLQFVLICWY